MSKKALGKGLGALIRDFDDPRDSGSVVELLLSSLEANPYQPRKIFSDGPLKSLADSIREKGVLQPLLVQDRGDGRFIIVAGERRFRAAKMAGLERVPAIVHRLEEDEKIEIALIENLQREDLGPLEEAEGYKRLMEISGSNQSEVARRVGKDRSTIANVLRLLKLPDVIREALQTGSITAGHARAILALPDAKDQKTLFQQILIQGLSVRQTEKAAQTLTRPNRPRTSVKRNLSPDLEEVQQRLIESLGTKVRLQGSLRKGHLVISYFTQDELSRIVEMLGVTDGAE